MIDLSLIVPCYQESGHLAESMAEIRRVLSQSRLRYEIVFVDDGSQDDTRDIIRQLCRDDSHCRFIFHEKNKGRGGAFKTGFLASTGRVVGFLDVDLEVHALYIPYLVSLVAEGKADIATGRRFYVLSQTGGWVRHLFSQVYRWLIRKVCGFNIQDSETGCKFFSRETAGPVIMAAQSDGWFWDTEVMMRADMSNLKIIESPVLFLRRADKHSTVRLIPDTFRYLLELTRSRPRFGLAYSKKSPIYWTTWTYDLALTLSRGNGYKKIFADVARLIEPGSSVVDLCCGTARLYRDFLKDKGCAYTAFDFNGHFVKALRKKGIDARQADLLALASLPSADYVVMCSSFMHFHGSQEKMLEKMRRAARRAVIISEPIQNMSQHRVTWIARLANKLTNPGVGRFDFRFNLESFRAFGERHGAAQLLATPTDPIGIAVFEARSAVPAAPPVGATR